MNVYGTSMGTSYCQTTGTTLLLEFNSIMGSSWYYFTCHTVHSYWIAPIIYNVSNVGTSEEEFLFISFLYRLLGPILKFSIFVRILLIGTHVYWWRFLSPTKNMSKHMIFFICKSNIAKYHGATSSLKSAKGPSLPYATLGSGKKLYTMSWCLDL